jgi:hypothetical protein
VCGVNINIKMSEMGNNTWITQMRTFLIEFKSLSVIVSIELKVTGATLLSLAVRGVVLIYHVLLMLQRLCGLLPIFSLAYLLSQLLQSSVRL